MAKNPEKSKLADFKKEYEKLRKKHSLPPFEKLNEDFGIEKAAESETENPIREIRKLVAEKSYNYLRLVETLINPVNAPMSVMSIVKTFGIDERNSLSEIYKKLVKNEFQLIAVDVEFSEKNEAEFIKDTCKIWQEIKKDFLGVVKSVEKNFDSKAEGSNRRYFG